MSKDPLDGIMALMRRNGARLVQQSGMSNQDISAAAARAGATISPKSVSNMLAGRHKFTIKSLTAFAAATDVSPWLLLAPNLPEKEVRQDLEWLVSAFSALPREDRESMMRAAKNAAIAAGIETHGQSGSSDREVGRIFSSKSRAK
jgi:hypothetical protein